MPEAEVPPIGLMTIGWMIPLRLIDVARLAIPCSEMDRRG